MLARPLLRSPEYPPYPAGNITVSLGGNEASVIIRPAGEVLHRTECSRSLPRRKKCPLRKSSMSALCIRHNRFRYSAFGREANRTLRTLPIPDRAEFPSWLSDCDVTQLEEEYDTATRVAPHSPLIRSCGNGLRCLHYSTSARASVLPKRR